MTASETILPMGASLRSITVITPNYPRPGEAERGAFVERLVAQWQAYGVGVGVIAPLPWFSPSRSADRLWTRVPVAGDPVVYPRYLSVSARRFGSINLKQWSHELFVRAAVSAQRQLPVPDAFYGKFLFTGGSTAVRLARHCQRPAFADLGESTLLAGLSGKERARASNLLRACAGVVCVSPRLMDEARELGVPEERLLLSPNVADSKRFHPMDRQTCRQTLGLPPDDFIVAFVGHFVERKGPLRVLEAINCVGGRVNGVFLGRGPQRPAGERVLHAAPVANSDLPIWLNACDTLVLPTLAEGCCNAIAEALACGLPVISSDIPDVRWQVPADAGRLIPPNDVDAIADAIREAVHSKSLSPTVPRVAGDPDRATRILQWLSGRASIARGSAITT